MILYPFGPVAFVYDAADTEGGTLPEAATNPFPAVGGMGKERINWFTKRLERKNIADVPVNSGTGLAGRIEAERTNRGCQGQRLSRPML